MEIQGRADMKIKKRTEANVYIRLLIGGALATLMSSVSVASVGTNYIDDAGNEWRPLTDTLGFTYAQVNTVCSGPDFACNGTTTSSIGITADFTGWTWASLTEVNTLLEEFTGFSILPDHQVNTSDSSWGGPLLDVFGTTSSQTWPSGIQNNAYGVTNDDDPTPSHTGTFTAMITDRAWTGGIDRIYYANNDVESAFNLPYRGVFLYRGTSNDNNDTGTAVPTPPTFWLLIWATLFGVSIRNFKRRT